MNELFYDFESDEYITIEELEKEYNELFAKNFTECETFKEYISSCLNGTLEIAR